MSSTEEINQTDPLKPFRPGLKFGFYNAITWQVTLGTPMVLYAERLGASTLIVGIVYSFVFLLSPIQTLGALLLPKYGYKRLMLGCWAMRSLFLLPLIWMAWYEPSSSQSWPLFLFVSCIFAFCVFRSIGVSGQMPWFYSILPDKVRGRFFASEQIFASVSSVTTLLLCAFLFGILDLFQALFWEFLLAFGGSIMSFISLAALADGKKPEPRSLSQTGSVAKSYLGKASDYRYYLVVHIFLVCCSTSLPPFTIYFLKVVQGVPSSDILLLVALQSMGVILSALIVKRAIDSVGPRSIFLLALILMASVSCLWFAILEGYVGGFWIYALCYTLMGGGACFWFTANVNYMPYLILEDDRHIMLAVNSSIVSLVSGIAPVLWGFLLKDQSDPLRNGMNIGYFEIFFISLFVVSTGLIAAISRIRITEIDRERPFRLASEVWRPFRAITSFSSNYPDTYSKKRPGNGQN